MKCEVDYCIYNREFLCTVDEIDINALGMCDACIIISFDKAFLEKEKKRQLDELEKSWKDDR